MAKRVWHYTNTAGLLGILDAQAAAAQMDRMGDTRELSRGAFSVRFTDAQYLNDPQEMRFARVELAGILQDQADTLSGEDRDELDEVLTWLRNPDKAPSRAGDITARGTYVACFSRAKDSLSQWSGYAGSRGYAIAFDEEVLGKMWAPIKIKAEDIEPGEHVLVRPKVYEMKYGAQAVTKWFKTIAPLIIEPRFENPRRYLCELALAIAKDDPYRHEEEVRAVVMRGPSPQMLSFREGALGVVPYLVVSYLPLKKNSPRLIREIMVGPGDEIEPRRDAVMQLVHERGFDPETEIPVTQSKILFRG
ncbi:DUF2971 domain-containing protein [Mycobacterium colombiense]|nr:DUF2971 domain-containing protein [Mycobacterium colombiense]